jgi:hypothetical protein
MNVTRDVIADLLPVYLAGEASADTRTLIEEYLRAHPDLAGDLRERTERTAELLSANEVSLSAGHEKSTLERIRRFNRKRTYLLALALACTLVPLSFAFVDGQVNWIMLRDQPKTAVSFWIAATVCWSAYYLTGRRLRTQGAARGVNDPADGSA